MPSDAEVIDRTRKAFELRRAGLSYREIASKLGMSVSTVHAAVKEWMDEYALQTEEHFQSVRSEATARLDAALVALWPQVRAGNPEAINAMLKIEAQRAKLWGLDAPARVDATVGLRFEVTIDGVKDWSHDQTTSDTDHPPEASDAL